MSIESEVTHEKLRTEKSCSTSTLPDVGPSSVLPFLFLGSQADVLSLKTMQEHRITHVINVSATGEVAPFLDENDKDHFLRIPIHDSLVAALLPYLDEAYEFIERARLNNGRVFIHCLAGIRRSAALAIAYTMRYMNLSLDDAYDYVKKCRSHISPNFNFLGQLAQYETNLPIKLKPKSPKISTKKCIAVETPFKDCRWFTPIQGCSTTIHSVGHQQTLRRPKALDLSRVSQPASSRLASLPNAFPNITIGSARPPVKPLRPNTMSVKCLSAAVTRKNRELRGRSVPKSADTLSSRESGEKICKLFSETNILSNPAHVRFNVREQEKRVE